MSDRNNIKPPPTDICAAKIKYCSWGEGVYWSAAIPLDAQICTPNNDGYLNIPNKLNLWVPDAPHYARISELSSVPNTKQYGFSDNPYVGSNFVNLTDSLRGLGVINTTSCYAITDSITGACNPTVFSPGFLHAPVPVIPYVVDTYIDTDKVLDISIDMPNIVIPDLVLPSLKTPDIIIPDIEIPDIVIPDIVIPDIVISDIVIPDIVIPDIVVPDVIVPDIIFPDQELNIKIPDITIPDIKIPTIEIPPIELPDIPLPPINIPFPPIEIPPIELPTVTINVVIPKINLGGYVTWDELARCFDRGANCGCGQQEIIYSKLGVYGKNGGQIGLTAGNDNSDIMHADENEWRKLFQPVIKKTKRCGSDTLPCGLVGEARTFISDVYPTNNPAEVFGPIYVDDWTVKVGLPPVPQEEEPEEDLYLAIHSGTVDWIPQSGIPPLPDDEKLYALTGQRGRDPELQWMEIGSCGS